MTTKTAPLGICDHCEQPIPRGDWRTSKGAPRRYCSRECRNTANSRAGNEIRTQKIRERVAKGEWVNPIEIAPPTPEEQGRRARLGRQREVEAETWRNPALPPAAKDKLSRPRKHDGDLHSAIEKLRRGTMADLTQTEADAYRRYRRDLRTARKDAANTARKTQ